MKNKGLFANNKKLFVKGVGYGVLGAVVGLIFAVPLSLVKTGLFSRNYCQPILHITDSFMLTSCGFMFYDNPLGCSLFAFLGGTILGFLGVLFQRKVLREENGVPNYRWSFFAGLLFVLFFVSVIWGQ